MLDLIERLDRDRHFHAIVIRSFGLCRLAIDRPRIRDRLWSTYVVEPERDLDDPAHVAELRRIADGSRWLVAQSAAMRDLTVRLAPAAAGRVLLLPPAIARPARRAAPDRPVRRLVYIGKIHPFYSIEQIVAALTTLRRDIPDLELHVAGDKIDGGPLGRDWSARVRALLTNTEGVVWHGALPRNQVLELLYGGGIAISVWDHRYGSRINDLVVSTKLLDYAAAGLPVVLTRTAAQADILGADYPLFVDTVEELTDTVRRGLVSDELYCRSAQAAFGAAASFAHDRVYSGIAGPLREATA